MKSSWKRMAGQSAWAMFGQAASALGTLAGFRLITEVVPATVYGIVALAIGLLTLGQWIAIQPLGQAAVRFYADCTSADDGALLRRATIRALMRPTLSLAAGLTLGLGAWSLGFAHEALLGPLCGLLFLADGARTVEVFFLSAEREQRTLAWLVAADAWLRPAFGVVAVLIFGPYAAAVVGGYLAGTLVALAVYYVARRGHVTQVPADAGSAESMAAITKRLWAYALPLLMLPIVGWVGSQADRYIVGGLVGLEAAGLYVAVYGIASRPFFVVRDAVELALRQVFYAQFSGGDPKRQRRVFLLWLGAVGGLSLLGWLAIVVLHRQVAGILLASQYRAYSALMIPIAGGYVLYVVSQVVERICYALHDSRGVVLIETSGAVLGVVIGVPMILAFGVEGAAWAVPIYFGLQLVVALLRARSALRLAGGPQTGMDELR